MAAAASASSAKSRSETLSSEFAVGRAKPSAVGDSVPIDRERGAGKGRGAERRFVHPGAGVGEAAAVAPEHLHIGEEMVAERHGLGGLKMGEARHHRIGMREGFFGQAPS